MAFSLQSSMRSIFAPTQLSTSKADDTLRQAGAVTAEANAVSDTVKRTMPVKADETKPLRPQEASTGVNVQNNLEDRMYAMHTSPARGTDTEIFKQRELMLDALNVHEAEVCNLYGKMRAVHDDEMRGDETFRERGVKTTGMGSAPE